jgi:uncharacterized membrane protein YebE (DUF533 family)
MGKLGKLVKTGVVLAALGGAAYAAYKHFTDEDKYEDFEDEEDFVDNGFGFDMEAEEEESLLQKIKKASKK